MKSLERIQKISKFLHIISYIIFVCSIVGVVISIIGSICVGVWGNEPEVINYVASLGQTYNFKSVLCGCICGAVESAFMIALYFYVKKFYKTELNIGNPFDKDLVKNARKVGVLHIVLPLLSTILCAIIIACFGVDDINISNISGITVGIVYLIVSCIMEYGVDLQKKKNN